MQVSNKIPLDGYIYLAVCQSLPNSGDIPCSGKAAACYAQSGGAGSTVCGFKALFWSKLGRGNYNYVRGS